MRLAEHESEGDNEELITDIVVDVQDPAAQIFEAARLGRGSHDTGRVITCFSEDDKSPSSAKSLLISVSG